MENLPGEDKRTLHALLILARHHGVSDGEVTEERRGTCRLGIVEDASGTPQIFVRSLDGTETNPQTGVSGK